MKKVDFGSKKVILIAAVIILVFSIIILVLIRPRRLYRIIANHPLLLFCFVFVLLFSFSVGLTTANFGALVRFKIPFQPFYVSFLIILGCFIFKPKGKIIEDLKE